MMKTLRLKNIALFLLLLALPAMAGDEKRLIILPFTNNSDFGGEWDLGRGVPEYLAQQLDSIPGYSVIPGKIVANYLHLHDLGDVSEFSIQEQQKIMDDLSAGYCVTGKINEFELSRLNIGSVTLGRMGNFESIISANCDLFSSGSDTLLARFRAESKLQYRDLEFTPAGVRKKKGLRFADLDTMRFASPAFMRTIVGMGLKKFSDNFNRNLQHLLPADMPKISADTAKPAGKLFKIIASDTEFAHINAGSEDGVQKGDIFIVVAEGDTLRDPDSGAILGTSEAVLGKIEIMLVKNANLSWAKFISREAEIPPNAIVRKY